MAYRASATPASNACQASSIKLTSSLEEVMKAIGLDTLNTDHVALYQLMIVSTLLLPVPRERPDRIQQEAQQGRQRMLHDRRALLPHLQNDASIKPPFYRTQIDNQAFLQQAQVIHNNAQGKTRTVYDHVSRSCAAGVANPLIRWLLWRVMCQGEGREMG